MADQFYKLTLEYDGSDFQGWQVQTSGRTVQGELEKALAIVLRRKTRVTAAGRTDAGVHARGQVVSVAALSEDPQPETLMGNLNGLLPHDVRVADLSWAPVLFDARRDAMSKAYRYLWFNRRSASPFWDKVSWHQARPLDLEAMQTAATCLIGKQDFSAMRAAQCSAPSPVRRVTAVEIYRDDDRVVMNICGEAFLQHMVRNIVGSLTQVGLRKEEPVWMQYLLDSRDRTLAGQTAPAKGLCLWRVDYGEIPRPDRKI